MNKLVCFLIGLTVFVQAKGQNHQRTLFNDGWQYLEKPIVDVENVATSEGWEEVTLPHTWNAEDVMDQAPGYRRNLSWYAKTLDLDEIKSGDRYFLYFEGSNIQTKVFVNNKLVKEHVGGYVGFRAELTSAIKSGANHIMVSVDNGYDRQVIPSQKADFFIYGGIVRDVWLEKSGPVFIDKIKISTPQVSEKLASTAIEVVLNGEIQSGQKLSIQALKPNGKVLLSKDIPIDQKTINYAFDTRKPELWDLTDPKLYTLKLSIAENDAVEEEFGYRWFEFKENGPFYLNGKRVLLKGTHRHEETAGLGAAMPNQMHRSDIKTIKDMGGNFVRLGHYPQDPEVYKACNELGILVWDELPWCRGGVGDEVWKSNTKRLLAEMIEQNYNEPSVIIWSLGNEIYWLPDFEGGGEESDINTFFNELNDLAHELDPYRKTAARKYYAGADIVDVFSPSIWSGWYSGTYKGYEEALNKSHKKYPHFLHMEFGGSSFIGRHKENPITGDGQIRASDWEEPINQVATQNVANIGDWSENYIVDLFDWYLKTWTAHPEFAGGAQWALKDFGTPLRPENDIPYVNQKGILTRDGKPKDAYYVFKSYWSDDPFAYIESHTWTERSGPKGKSRALNVYSNCDEVRLIANGQDLGKKERNTAAFPACGLVWDYSFKEGDNSLLAIGYNKKGKEIARDSMVLNYTYQQSGSPEELLLSYEYLDNGNMLITAKAVDNNGQRCLDYEERVYFQCMDGGTVLRNQGTATGSEIINMANGLASIELTPDANSEKVVMSVLNQSFKGTYLEIDLKTPARP